MGEPTALTLQLLLKPVGDALNHCQAEIQPLWCHTAPMDIFSFLMRSLVGGVVAAFIVAAHMFMESSWTETIVVAAVGFLVTAAACDA